MYNNEPKTSSFHIKYVDTIDGYIPSTKEDNNNSIFIFENSIWQRTSAISPYSDFKVE